MGKVLESARAWLWTVLVEPEAKHVAVEEVWRGLSAEDVLDQEYEEFRNEGGVVGDLIDHYPEESAALYLELGWSAAALGEHFSSEIIEAAEKLNKRREAVVGDNGGDEAARVLAQDFVLK